MTTFNSYPDPFLDPILLAESGGGGVLVLQVTVWGACA